MKSIKKLLALCIVFVVLLAQVCLGATLIIKDRSVTVTYDKTPGKTVTLTPNSSDITGWQVNKGDITIDNNQFVMPNEEVEIEPLYSQNQYTLTIIEGDYTTTRQEYVGSTVVVNAKYPDNFISWTAVGITLSPAQRISTSIQFTMPAKDVILTMEYEGELTNPETMLEFTWDTTDDLTKEIEIATTEETVINWGDGTLTTLPATSRTEITHTYSEAGIYTAGVVDDVVIELDCSSQNVSDIDISKATKLNWLECENNEISSLSVKNNTELKYLNCDSNEISSLDVRSNTKLEYLECQNNRLSSLDVGSNTKLNHLLCANNQISSLDVRKNLLLVYFDCANNQISSLDTSKNVSLVHFNCSENQLTAIDVSKNTGLEFLFCHQNRITSLNLTHNTSLKNLYCYINQLTTLDVSQNTALEVLSCGNNQLTTLDVSQNTALVSLYCDSNQLTKLDISRNEYINEGCLVNSTMNKLVLNDTQNTRLTFEDKETGCGIYTGENILHKHPNTRIVLCAISFTWDIADDLSKEITITASDDTIIDWGDGTTTEAYYGTYTWYHIYSSTAPATCTVKIKDDVVTKLKCNSEKITNLDVSESTKLEYLRCEDNQLSTLDVSNNTALYSLICYSNQLTALDISNNTLLTEFSCFDNQLTALSTSNNTKLIWFNCEINSISSLDVSNNTELTEFRCADNELTSLDVSNNTKLTVLGCGLNQLTSLDVSSNTKLTELGCYYNQLTALDVSNNILLTEIACTSNQLTSLDVSQNIALVELYCGENNIVELNVQNNINISKLCCVQESLTDLYLTNTQNTSLTKLTATIPCYSSMSAENTIHYHSNTTVTDLAIIYNANGGSGAPGTQYKTYNEPITLRQTIPTREGYTFVGWNTKSNGSGHWFVPGQLLGNVDNEPLALYAIWDDTTPNVPVINSTYMKPVDWNGTAWVEVSEGNWGYNYNLATANTNTVAGDGTAKWANAIVDSDGDGTFESYYVWIPRYSYKVSVNNKGITASGENSTNRVVSWNADTNLWTDQGRIDIKFSNGTNDYVSNGYKVHPAFTFGDEELTGIWVAKYEMSMETNGVHTETSSAAIGDILTSANPSVKMVSKPGVSSWRYIRLTNIYTNVRNMNTALDSHLMKNTEWGAVTYLTSGRGRIPYNNNSNAFITGSAAATQGGATSSTRYDATLGDNNTEFAYNTVKGVKGSTTHNIYGVYDMSGGAYDYVAYVLNNGNTQANMANMVADKDTKYVDLYTPNDSGYGYTESEYGDAIFETSIGYNASSPAYTNGTWDDHVSHAASQGLEGLARGGMATTSYPGTIGIFGFYSRFGTAYDYASFRAVIVPEKNTTEE